MAWPLDLTWQARPAISSTTAIMAKLILQIARMDTVSIRLKMSVQTLLATLISELNVLRSRKMHSNYD